MKRVVSKFNIEGLVVAIAGVVLIGVAGYLYHQSQKAVVPDDTAARVTISQTEKTLHQMSTRQKVASLLMLHTPGVDAQNIVKLVSTYQPGGFILMGDNISDDLAKVATLTKAAQDAADPYPLFIATDEEGCTVKRLPQDTFACARDLGSEPVSVTEHAFAQRGQLLQQAGVNLNFGIVADMTDNPSSFIYPRVFGDNANNVGQHVAAAVEGSQPYVWSTLKHFPGHGATAADSHSVIPRVDTSLSEWESYEASPFEIGIGAGAEAVMMSHLVYQPVDNLPASLSPKWHTILSQELGFDGLSVTDDLIMLQQSHEKNYQDVVSNVIASINAGNHINLIVNDHNVDNQPWTNINVPALLDGVEEAVLDDRIHMDHLDELVLKTLEWRQQLAPN